jgi:hypothetical protein
MALSEARKGEIALLALKHKLRKDGIRLTKDVQRDIGNGAKDIGIPYQEALEFYEGLVRELVEETFSPKK